MEQPYFVALNTCLLAESFILPIVDFFCNFTPLFVFSHPRQKEISLKLDLSFLQKKEMPIPPAPKSGLGGVLVCGVVFCFLIYFLAS